MIDPVLAYSTYLGGSSIDRGRGISVDAVGSAYVTGDTLSTDFPTTPGALQPSNSSAAFVAKFDPNGNLVYATYLGGYTCADDRCLGDAGTAIDAAGTAYITGSTDAASGGTQHVLVAALNASGSALSYVITVGGRETDIGNAIAVDPAGNAYVTGSTRPPDFPTTPGAVDRDYAADLACAPAYL